MSKWKKHAALPLLAVALIVIAAMGLNTYGMRNNGTFELKDLSGSRKALGDAAISGELRDGYHRTAFRLQDGQVDTQTEIFAQPAWAEVYRYNPGRTKRLGDMEYSVQNTLTSYEISSRKRKYSYYVPEGWTTVTPHLTYKGPDREQNGITLANPPEYGLAAGGSGVYFTVPVSAYFTGQSGIYKLNFSEWGFPTPENEAEYAPVRIADISLDANKSGQGAGIEVLGLEAVGDGVALIFVENNTLRIRSYDGDSGEIRGEAAVPSFYLPAREGNDRPAGAEAYYEGYEAHVDQDLGVLNLSFRSSASTNESTHVLMLSVDFSDGVNIVCELKTAFADGEEDTYSGISHISFRNGKLYVIKTFRERATDESRFMYDIVRPKHFYVYVYEQSELAYKGELVTDLNEDNIKAKNLSALSGGFGYDQTDYRYFANIAVQ